VGISVGRRYKFTRERTKCLLANCRSDASTNIGKIRKWLKPNDKTVLEVVRHRREALDHRAEYTCDWFLRYLLDFSRGKKDVLLVTGPEGCGKTVLSGWITERLQHPLAKKTFVTLSYSLRKFLLDGNLPLAGF
jgi:polynucleotide 5'-kinase involved in rRNA processing